jgi:hypothetical protein
MSVRMRCYTIFDITNTGVLNRSKPPVDATNDWLLKRNTQCNFDTILQVISLRSQPEVTKLPAKIAADSNLFGTEHTVDYCWMFEFEVHHDSVFDNGIIPVGGLYSDCAGVPMIRCDSNFEPSFLDYSPEQKNIHFEVL